MGIAEAIVSVLAITVVCGLPLFALSVRFAFKPLLEMYLKARHPQMEARAELDALRTRVAALEAVWEHRLGAGSLEPAKTLPTLPERARS